MTVSNVTTTVAIFVRKEESVTGGVIVFLCVCARKRGTKLPS